MFSVYQHWDPLKVCVLGRGYPPEFFHWIDHAATRAVFEKIALETEEDFQTIKATLESFGTEVLRPDLPLDPFGSDGVIKPPIMPRDHTIMIGTTFYSDIPCYDFGHFFYNSKRPNWPHATCREEIEAWPDQSRSEFQQAHDSYVRGIENNGYRKIFQRLKQQGNSIKTFTDPHITGPFVTRIGRDLFFGTFFPGENVQPLQDMVDREFPHNRNHVVNTGGHSDGTFCPVCPGLIISSYDIKSYHDTFPGWEVIYVPPPNLSQLIEFQQMKRLTQGRWWLPGLVHDHKFTQVIDTYMKHWVGFVEETLFDVNILIVDPKNVLVFNHNQKVFNAFDRYGITAHVVPFRHRYFWDGGVHCITSDLHRSGHMEDYFTQHVGS